MTHTPHSILFDLDGTLVDTAEDFVHVLNQQRSDHGLSPLESSLIRNTVSDGARALTKLAFGGNPGETRFESFRQELLDRYQQSAGDQACLFEGMSDVLTKCQEIGVPWGIITNKPRLYTDILLQKLNLNGQPLKELSAVTLCPDDVANSKPHPESLLLASSILKLSPQQCVYVGDHERDIAAGKAAKMPTVAALYGYIDPNHNHQSWQADYYINNPLDLISLFLT